MARMGLAVYPLFHICLIGVSVDAKVEGASQRIQESGLSVEISQT